MPWSHQTESAFSVSELVSLGDFHGGPSLSNLYDGARDGHNLHFDVHAWTRVGRMGPPPKICGVSTWLTLAALSCF